MTALQAAHAATIQTPVLERMPARHLQDALVEAVRLATLTARGGRAMDNGWPTVA